MAPANPPDYSCPICGHDEDAYLRCNDPRCLDGRDQPRFRRAYQLAEAHEGVKLLPPSRWHRFGQFAFVVIIVSIIVRLIWPNL